jgi:membrane protein implicated in regulation of membrane protease activity
MPKVEGVKEFVTYTAARLGLFAACYLVVLGVTALLTDGPLPVLWPLLIAAVVSTVLAAFLLRGMRERFADRVTARAERMTAAQEQRPQ